MKRYWIDKVINFTKDGEEEITRGFYLELEENTARIVVPYDIRVVPAPGTLHLYLEEIPVEHGSFRVCYEDGYPVSVEDGELLGELE